MTISASGGPGSLQMVRARHWTMCQPSRYSPKGVDTRQCANKDAGPKEGGFGGGPTSIGGRKECKRGCWAPMEGLWCPTLVGEENKLQFTRVWKLSPSRHVLKRWGEALGKTWKEKPKEAASGGSRLLQKKMSHSTSEKSI